MGRKMLTRLRAASAVIVSIMILLISCLGGRPEVPTGMDAIRDDVARLRTDLAELSRSVADWDETRFTLQLLHASDMDGTTGALRNVENFSAILSGFRAELPENTLVLSSGDNFIPGPRYYAAGDPSINSILGSAGYGRADVALLNAMGFQASALGNHELDRGTGEFASIISAEVEDNSAYLGARFPYLSGNLEFTSDSNLVGLVAPDGQEARLVGGSLARSAVVTVSGQRIGIVGATTPSLPLITGIGDIVVAPTGYDLDSLAAIIQESVDALTAQGINKVILLAHMQRFDVEQALAEKLREVDIIVAGGSNTLLADDTDRLRLDDVPADTYPLLYQSSTDQSVLLVNTDGDYRYLGRLVVDFDAGGRIIPDSIDPYVSGVYATDLQGGQLFAGQPIPEVSRIAESLRLVLQERDGDIAGRTAVYLAGRRVDVRTQETNLGNLIADAFLWTARQLDPETQVSLKNSGGIRDSIGLVTQPPGTISLDDVQFLPPQANPVVGKREGDVSRLDIEGALRFNNGVSIIPLTAKELVGIIEHTISAEGVGEVPSSLFPQVGGMRFSFDSSAPSGQRIRSLAIVDDAGQVLDRVMVNGSLSGDPERRIKMATMNFLANGGSGYPFPFPHPGRVDLSGEAVQPNPPNPDFPDSNGNGRIDGPQAVDPGLSDFAASGTEQDALAEYLAHFYANEPFNEPETSPLNDRRIQNLSLPGMTDTVFHEEDER